jgi:putative redox protein
VTTTGGSGRPQADNAGGSGGHPPTNSAGGSERHAHTTSVLARWEGGWRCRVEAGDFELIVDEPESAGGTGTGPMPTEYLLAAMASCYALALAWAAAKRGVTLPGLAVTATGSYDGPRFCRLQLSVDSGAPPAVIEPLIEPALRVCYVSNTLAASPPIEVTVAPAAPAAPADSGP